jgi:hypothetical protein
MQAEDIRSWWDKDHADNYHAYLGYPENTQHRMLSRSVVPAHDIADGALAVGNAAMVIGTTKEYLACKREEMLAAPRFGEEYTLRYDVMPNALKR